MKMAAASRFPPFFFHPCSALWEGRERRDRACVVKRPTCIVASLRMRKYTFFYHKFVLQGVFSKRNDCKSYIGISIYIFSGAHGLPIFLIALTRAHASENYFYNIARVLALYNSYWACLLYTSDAADE